MKPLLILCGVFLSLIAMAVVFHPPQPVPYAGPHFKLPPAPAELIYKTRTPKPRPLPHPVVTVVVPSDEFPTLFDLWDWKHWKEADDATACNDSPSVARACATRLGVI